MDYVNRFAEVSFRLESSSLTITNSTTGSIFSGPGEVWQDLKGKIFFKIYLNSKAKALFEYCRSTFRVGHFRRPSEYFDLVILGPDGTTWTAGLVWPSSRKAMGGDSALITGRLRELQCTQPYPDINVNWVEMRFRGQLNYPATIPHEVTESLGGRLIRRQYEDGAALVESNGYKFRIFHSKTHTVAQLTCESLLPKNIAEKVGEALRFCLASPVDCVAVTTVKANQCTSEISLRESLYEDGFIEGCFLPIDLDPLPPDDYTADFWRLFKRYLEYANKSSAKDVARLSDLVFAVVSSRRVSMSSEVLALCTGVEGVATLSMATLKDYIQGYEGQRKEALAVNAQLENAISIISNDPRLESNAKQRIIRAIKGWTKESSMSVLDAFLAAQMLPKRLFESWKALRHPSAHGSVKSGVPVDMQFQRMNDVRFIFYLNVMVLVGYNGPCVNYSVEGWPTYLLETWPVLLDPD